MISPTKTNQSCFALPDLDIASPLVDRSQQKLLNPFTFFDTLPQREASPSPQPEISSERTLFSPGDAILSSDGLDSPSESLPIRGSSVSIREANRTTQKILDLYKINISQLHESQLVHGSTSASLLSFTEYGDRLGSLLPFGDLEKMGKVSFCGELRHGVRKNGVNHSCLSTVWAGSLQSAFPYTLHAAWSPTKPVQIKEDFPEDMRLLQEKVQAARKKAWGQLTDIERDLVSNPFPVLYGIKSNRKNAHHLVSSDIPGEIGLLGGAFKEEIKVIFVPETKTSDVKKLLEENNHSVFTEPFPFPSERSLGMFF